MKKNYIEELKWRGMLQEIMPGTEELLQKEMVHGYIGFDPTADSLGIGNMVQIMTLLHFQQCGHKPIALIGGATGMVGDPSGKSEERNLLNEDILNHNLACQQKQLEKFLDFNCGDNSAEIVNNYDWFKDFSFLDFIRDVGKHITVNYMMAKDSVKKRLEGENGMSFTEFTYQLVQGYDFYWLWKNKNMKIQMGGSDQWGNIVTGTELIRRMGGGSAFALVTPLIKKADGTKFGKTESGNIWLDPEKTSPFDFYQFWLNSSDEDIKTYIRIFSLKGQEEIEALEKEQENAPHLRLLQKDLAKELTIRVHSKDEFDKVLLSTIPLFDKNSNLDNIKMLSDKDFEIVRETTRSPDAIVAKENLLIKQIDPVDILLKSKLVSSKSEAIRLIKSNSVSFSKVKVQFGKNLNLEDILFKHYYVLIEIGKTNKKIVRVIGPKNKYV